MKKGTRILIVQGLLLALGVLFLLLGLYRGEAGTVFQKATAICLECIGIG